ncbi:MAG: protease [Firmicutes bacterium]|nr:protease [Bacillota bacterium]
MAGKKVLLFLGEGFEDLEAVSVLSVCGWTEYRSHLEKVNVVTTGLHQEIHGRFGLHIAPDLLIDEVDPKNYAALVVPGGFHSHGFDEAYCQPLRDLAKTIHKQGGIIATMCVGILPIAEADLLIGEEATSYAFSRNHDNLGRLHELGCRPTPGPIVMSNRIISCSGPAQSIDVAMMLLESLIGVDQTKEVARFMAGTDAKKNN